MLTVKHKIGNSFIAGLGLIADEDIPKDFIVWKNFTDSELIITISDYDKMSEYMQDTFQRFGYRDKTTDEWKLPLDNSRFMNHSEEPNLVQDKDGNSVASKNIIKGEELCCNYREFVDVSYYPFL